MVTRMRMVSLAVLAGCTILVLSSQAQEQLNFEEGQAQEQLNSEEGQAQQQLNFENLSLGVGISYITPDVDGMPELQSAVGFNISAGFQIDEHASVVLDVLIMPKIENDEDAEFSAYSSSYYTYAWLRRPVVEFSGMGYFVSFKYEFNPQADLGGVLPYLSIGVGSMKFTAEEYAAIPPEASYLDWGNATSYGGGLGSVSGTCIRLGGGVAYYFKPNMSLSADITYLDGSGDLDVYSHVEAGASYGYHF